MNTQYYSIDCGNNESVGRGVVKNSDGTYTAMTFTNSKDFKSKLAADKWFKKQMELKGK